MMQAHTVSIDKVKVAVCIDIGDGTCTAHAIRVNQSDQSTFQPILLKLTPNSDVEIESALYYHENEHIDIGYQLIPSENVECVTNFKRCPPFEGAETETWDAPNGDTLSEKPFRDYMVKYISILWKNIYDQYTVDNGILSKLENENIVLYVGCPSSKNWNKEKYRELIQEATNMRNVVVVNETTAGICRAIRELDMDVKLSDCIAVLDFGSSTLDFTYVENGRITEERSWSLGANIIERNMFRGIRDKLIDDKMTELEAVPCINDEMNQMIKDHLEKQKMRILDQVNFLKKLEDSLLFGSLLLDIRKKGKEYYYDHRKDEQKTSFKYSMLDMGTVLIDDDFMHDVVRRVPLENITENGDSQLKIETDDSSWFGTCRAILEDIRNNNVGEKKIQLVVTGGASRMDFVHPLCKEVFENNLIQHIANDRAPQNCVSYGLCQVALNDIRAARLIQNKTDDLLTKESYADISNLCEKLYDDIVNYLYDHFAQIMEEAKKDRFKGWSFGTFSYDMKFIEFQSAVNMRMAGRVKKEELDEIRAKYAKDFENLMNQKYRKIEKEISFDLYGHDIFGGYQYRLPKFELRMSEIGFSKGFDICKFLTSGEEFVRIFSNELDAFRIVHPYRFVSSPFLGHRRPMFGTAAVNIMKQMGLPAQDYNYEYQNAVTLLERNSEFKEQIQANVENMVKRITMQN